MLTKSRAGYTNRRVPFYSNFSATFNVEYLRMCWDINLILDLNRQEHVQNVAELLLDIIERQSVIAALFGHILNAMAYNQNNNSGK